MVLCHAERGVRSTVPCELLVLSGWNAGDWGKAARCHCARGSGSNGKDSSDPFARYCTLVTVG